MALSIVGGCYQGFESSLDGAASLTDGETDAGPSGTGNDGSTGGQEPEPFGSDCDALLRSTQRLSSRQYGNAVRDLLHLAEAPQFSSGGEQLEAFFPQGSPTITTPMAVELQQLAEQASAAATEDLTGLVECDPTVEPLTDGLACARDFAEQLATRAYRRPVQAAELDGLMTVYQTGVEQEGTLRGGVELIIQAVLQSPSFLYRIEVGQQRDDGLFVLGDYEVAGALGFFLLDSLPDQGLLDAAERGDLSNAEGVRAEVDRLLEDPAVQANVSDMFVRWFGTHDIERIERDDPDFTETLRSSMRQETERFVDAVLWERDGSMRELLTSRETFVDAELAALYGVEHPGGSELVPVTLPAGERAGLLTQASVVASRAHPDESSIVYRGLLIARDLLCLSYPAPPPGATDPEASQGETEREKATFRMTNPPCNGCHASFEPFGVLLEHYDEIGRYRTETNFAPVEAEWEVQYPSGVAGNWDGVVEFVEVLATSKELLECTSNRVTGYAVGHALEGDDNCHESLVYDQFAQAEGDLVELVRIIASSDSFRFRRGEAQ